MTRGRRGGGIVVLVPFVDVLHGYFNLDLLHIVARQAIDIGFALARILARILCILRLPAILGGSCQLSAQAGSARRQPLLLLGDGGQQRLIPVL